jgi:hypothetical protein
VEDEDCVTQKPQMWGNEEEQQMEDLKVKIILIFELQMTNKSLNDDYRSEELVFFNEMDHEILNEKSML